MVPLGDDLFADAVRLEKVYKRFFQSAVEEYRFTPNEVAVLLFLSQNAPEQDTATDIAQARGISKALVARSVDRLQRCGMLEGVRDGRDRRVIHLRLCGEGPRAAERLQENGRFVAEKMQQGISDREIQLVHEVMAKMQRNLDALLESKER